MQYRRHLPYELRNLLPSSATAKRQGLELQQHMQTSAVPKTTPTTDDHAAITRCTAPHCSPSPRSCPPAAAQTPPRTRCSSHTTRTSPGTRTRRRRCSCTPSVPRGSRPGATPSTARLTVRGWLTALATTTADSSWHNLGATPGRSCTHRHSSCFARRWTQRLRHRHRHTATARTSTIPNLTLQRAVPT